MANVCQSVVRKQSLVCFSKTHHLLSFPLLPHKVSWDEGAPFCSIIASCRVTKLAQFGIFPLLALNRQSVPQNNMENLFLRGIVTFCMVYSGKEPQHCFLSSSFAIKRLFFSFITVITSESQQVCTMFIHPFSVRLLALVCYKW